MFYFWISNEMMLFPASPSAHVRLVVVFTIDLELREGGVRCSRVKPNRADAAYHLGKSQQI